MIRKEKENRKNRGNRKYGQAKLRHSRKGVLSCGIAGFVLAVLLCLLAAAYFTRGKAAAYIGAFGIIAFIIACVGCSLAFRGFRERDKNYLTCKLGMGFNIFFIIGFISIFFRGLM